MSDYMNNSEALIF